MSRRGSSRAAWGKGSTRAPCYTSEVTLAFEQGQGSVFQPQEEVKYCLGDPTHMGQNYELAAETERGALLRSSLTQSSPHCVGLTRDDLSTRDMLYSGNQIELSGNLVVA